MVILNNARGRHGQCAQDEIIDVVLDSRESLTCKDKYMDLGDNIKMPACHYYDQTEPM